MSKVADVIQDAHLGPVGVSPIAKAILVHLAARWADPNGKRIFPAVDTIVEKTEFSESTVHRALAELRGAKLLVVVAAARQHRTCEYEINVDLLRRLRRITGVQGSQRDTSQRSQRDTSETRQGCQPERSQPDTSEIQGCHTETQGCHTETQGSQPDTQSPMNPHEPPEEISRASGSQGSSGQKPLLTWGAYVPTFDPAGQQILVETAAALASTRKTGTVAPSVLDGLARKLVTYPPGLVIAGCEIYLSRGCAAEGKKEPYLLAIVRGEAERKKLAVSTNGVSRNGTAAIVRPSSVMERMIEKHARENGWELPA